MIFRDHSHLPGKYRGPAHITCDLNAEKVEASFISMLIHNFSVHDCPLVFLKLFNATFEIKIEGNDAIPETSENTICVQIG